MLSIFHQFSINDTSFSELRKNAELLTFMCDNKIQSIADFENTVNAAAEQAETANLSSANAERLHIYF